MKFWKFIPVILCSAWCALPLAAQTVPQQTKPAKNTAQTTPVAQNNRRQSLDTQVEAAVVRAQATCTCASEDLSADELIAAEEELQRIRDKKDSNASFDQYPYLLDPTYRRQQSGTCPCASKAVSPTAATASAGEEQELTVREQIEAEEELSLIRNTRDTHATFEKYPYLISPAYRRAGEDGKRSIRRQYTNPSWARSVGL